MERDCLEKSWDVAVYIGQLQGTLITEGARQKTVMHENWTAPAIALPIDGDVLDDFDSASKLLVRSVKRIQDYCMESPPRNTPLQEKASRAIGEANLFESPFQREADQRGRHQYAPTAQQLWFELSMITDFVMDWVDEINMSEPYRYAEVSR